MNKKAQSNILAVVLLTIIVLLLINLIYFWGAPLLEKTKDKATMDMVEENFKILNEKITNVAYSGGQEQLSIEYESGFMKMVNDTETMRVANSSIPKSFYSLQYSVTGKHFVVESDYWVDFLGKSNINCCEDTACTSINSDNCTINAGGPDENAGVIAGRAISTGAGTGIFQNYLLLKYREIDKNTGEGTIINLVPGGNTEAGTGKNKILIKNLGTETFAEKSSLGSTLSVINIEITFS